MPTIHESALIVTFNVSSFSPKKVDRAASRETCAAKGAASDAGEFVKLLVSRTSVSPITSVISAARAYHYENTLPWIDGGGRIIPLSHYPVYKAKMESFSESFEAAVQDFCEGYSEAVAQARVRLAALFNEADYPTEIRNKFAFRMGCLPVPQGSDFRLNVSPEERVRMADQVNASVSEAVHNGVRDVALRVQERLEAVVERLSDPEAIFRDSLIENLREVDRMIPILNLTNDGGLNEVRNLIHPILAVDPQILREDRVRRAAICEAARTAISVIDGKFPMIADYEEI